MEDKVSKELLRVQHFVDVFQLDLHLLFVNTPTYFEETITATQRMDAVKEKYGLTHSTVHIYNAHQIEQGIIAFSEQNKMDLIAMVTHGYSGMQKMFNDNLTESVVNHSEIPVLSFHIR